MHCTAEQLEAVIPALPEKDHSFAHSLLKGHRQYGHFTAGQQKWVDILVARGSEDPSVARQDIQLDKTLNPTGVVIRLFQAGKSSLDEVRDQQRYVPVGMEDGLESPVCKMVAQSLVMGQDQIAIEPGRDERAGVIAQVVSQEDAVEDEA